MFNTVFSSVTIEVVKVLKYNTMVNYTVCYTGMTPCGNMTQLFKHLRCDMDMLRGIIFDVVDLPKGKHEFKVGDYYSGAIDRTNQFELVYRTLEQQWVKSI